MDYKNIKFRAWHKEQKKMFEVLVLDMNSGEVFLDGFTVETQYKGETQQEPMWISVDEVELMMYIGQQDKNGKDIYEGDIVSTTVLEDYTIYTQICEIDTYIATSIDTESYGGPGMSVVYTDIEIIGNKYENPELV